MRAACSAKSFPPAARSSRRSAVSYLGPQGTFSEQAVRQHFGQAVAGEPTRSIDEAFRSAESGASQFAVVPAENSTDGAVGRTLDLLLTTPLRICGEVDLRVKQNLLSRMKGPQEIKINLLPCPSPWRSATAGSDRTCRTPERIPVGSTGRLRAARPRKKAPRAIAGASAAALVQVEHHRAGIEDDPNNTTRFLVLGRWSLPPPAGDRTSLVMSAENKPGAVHALLSPIAANGVSMCRSSRAPRRRARRAGNTCSSSTSKVHQADAKVAAAIGDLKARAPFLKILGSYPIASN
jgi:chorismate mutase/prephenate dehydratase